MSDDENKGFIPAIFGVILGGVGFACMSLPNFPPMVGVLMMIGGVILCVKGLAK